MIKQVTQKWITKIRQQVSLLKNNLFYCISPFNIIHKV